MIAVRYAGDQGWVLCDEAGGSMGRRADVIAFHLWGSRGHLIHGFELKVNRQDWIRELRQPAKTEESLFRFCDGWYVVTAPGVATLDEIPAMWGWIEAAGSKLMTRKKAPTLRPAHLTREFMAALIKRYDAVEASQRTAARAEIRDQVRAELVASMDASIQKDRVELLALREEVARVRKLFGWADTERDQQVIRLARAMLSDRTMGGFLNNARHSLTRLMEELTAFEAQWNKTLGDLAVPP